MSTGERRGRREGWRGLGNRRAGRCPRPSWAAKCRADGLGRGRGSSGSFGLAGGARFGSRGVADTRRGEMARESEREREGERGCGMAARAAMILQDLVGHTSQMRGPVVGTGKGEVREVKGVELPRFYHGWGPGLGKGRSGPIRCSTECLFEVLNLF